ncbi:MAG: YbaN family protein [Methanomassiliicoccus sp.]|nr:YbaN family protein [Methanomassiliicoccus sp.]
MPSRTMEIKNKAWTAAGVLCVGLGGVGALLPVMPTAPFLLLAAGCFARGSPRAYRWLMESPLFGRHLRAYLEGRGLTRRMKAASISAVILGLAFSEAMSGFKPLMTVLVIVVGAAVIAHLVLLPTADREA